MVKSPKVAIVYFSGYGHTQKIAEAVELGAKDAGGEVSVLKIPADGTISDEQMDALDSADAIIYGAPTYMGGPAWQFKKFADQSSKKWFTRLWQDKIAGGFTVSASQVGDKGQTLAYLHTLASQHGQIWVSLGLAPSNTLAATEADLNRSGGSVGLTVTAPSDSSPDQAPFSGDIETAKTYGARIVAIASRFNAN
jgi:NAD(P)H dehydrogenase (quinone)